MAKWVQLPPVVVSLLLVFSFIGSSALSQSSSASSLLPLESILNPDGSFHSGAGLTGSFDPAGWHMFLGPHGRPMFSRVPETSHIYGSAGSDTGDVHWDDSYPGPVGADEMVVAIAVRGDDIYFGGSFTGTEAIEASNIVCWDGTSWKALGTGVDKPVTALAFVDCIHYVAGGFSNAGGVPVNGIAAWNDTSWSSLGQHPLDGVDPSRWVGAMISMGSELFVAGRFKTVGSGIVVNNIARWDGSTWHALGSGTDPLDYILALATDGVSVFIGGYITYGGTPAHNISRWNGTVWHTLGTYPNDGCNDAVRALTFAHGTLYVGGDFTAVGGSVGATHIATWDSSHWSSLRVRA